MLHRERVRESTYGALREILSNFVPVMSARPDPRFWAEAVEAAIADYQLKSLLASHHDDEVISEEALQQWQRLFFKRWARVRDTSLAYPANTQSTVNQIYSALADFFQPLLNIPRFQLLMPDIESAASCITMTDLAEENLSLTDIVLSDDCKSFIEVKACLLSAVEDAALKHTQVLEDGKVKLLSMTEAERVVSHHSAALELYKAIQKKYDFKHNGTTVGACLHVLIEGLRSGGVNRSRNEAERKKNEMNATEPANLAILAFHDVYMALSKEQRDELNALKDDYHDFWYYWDILALQQQRKIDAIKNNKQLMPAQRIAQLKAVHASITTCVQITANGLEALLDKNKDKLFAMRLNSEVAQQHPNLLEKYDQELQKCRHLFEENMRLFANGLPYRAGWLGDVERAKLETKVLRWLNVVGKLSYQAVMAHALELLDVDSVFACILPQIRYSRRHFAMRLMLSAVRNSFPVQVAASADHSYFLNKNGSLSMSGSSMLNLLDPGLHLTPQEFISMAGLPNEKIIQLACGLHHMLCLTEDGNVYGRGQSDKGQLGFFSHQEAAFVKIFGLPPETKVVRVLSHLNNSVLISADSKIYMMGESVNDPYGNLHADPPSLICEIKGLPANASITQAAFSKHLLILTEDGKAYGMGNSEFGQLGFKDYDDINHLVEINNFPAGTRLVQAAAGNIHSLFLTDDGKVFSCGSNRRGQQGTTNLKTKSKPREVTGLPVDDKVVQIAAGLYNSFFLTEQGRVFACGWNDHGQLGLGEAVLSDRVTSVTELTGLPPGTRITGITPTMEVDSCTFLFAADGSVYGFGWDGKRHLGFPHGSMTDEPHLLPRIAKLNSRIEEIEHVLSHRQRRVQGQFFLPSRDITPEPVSYITEYPSP